MGKSEQLNTKLILLMKRDILMTNQTTQYEALPALNLNTEVELSKSYVEFSDDDLINKYDTLAAINTSELMPHATTTLAQLLGRITFEITMRQSESEANTQLPYSLNNKS